MNKLIFALISLLVLQTVSAQEQPNSSSSMKSPIPLAPGHDDRLVVDITLDNFAEAPGSIEVNTFKSRGVNIKLMKDKLIKNSLFSIGYGLAFGSQNFDTDRLFIYNDSLDFTFLAPVDPNADVKKISFL